MIVGSTAILTSMEVQLSGVDILQLLRGKALTGEQYYGALTKLRAGDYRHLPMLTDEIVTG